MFLTLLLVTLGAQTSTAQRPASESADIVLLIDSSDALGRRAFPAVKSFVNRIINSFPIGPNRYRIALVQYSDDVKVEFHLDDYKAKNPMLNQLKKVSFKGGPLRIGHAIRSVHEIFIRSPRKDRNQIMVITTSATSDDHVEEAASQLRRDGIKIIALGLEEAVPQMLQSIATPPFHYKFGTPRDLLAFSQNMSEVIGKAIQMTVSAVTPTPASPSVTESVTTGTIGPVSAEGEENNVAESQKHGLLNWSEKPKLGPHSHQTQETL